MTVTASPDAKYSKTASHKHVFARLVDANGVEPAAGSSVGTSTSVNSATSSTTLLAANTARKGAAITNTDANRLYVLLGSGTASSTNYTISLETDDYYEVPTPYRGVIKGIWAADGAGAAIVTEF